MSPLRIVAAAAALLLTPHTASAQATRPVLLVWGFEMPVYSYDRSQLAALLKGTLIGALKDARMVTVVDRTNSRRVAGTQPGARYVTYGVIDKLDVLRNPKTQTYAATLVMTINLLDAMSGEVLASKQINGSSEPPGKKLKFGVTMQQSANAKSSTEAMSLLSQNITPEITAFYQGAIPVEYPVASVSEVARDSSTAAVLIACGSGCGIEVGQRLKIVEHANVTVAGKQMVRRTDLGFADVVKVEDANFSIGQLDKDGAKQAIRRVSAKATVVAEPIR